MVFPNFLNTRYIQYIYCFLLYLVLTLHIFGIVTFLLSSTLIVTFAIIIPLLMLSQGIFLYHFLRYYSIHISIGIPSLSFSARGSRNCAYVVVHIIFSKVYLHYTFHAHSIFHRELYLFRKIILLEIIFIPNIDKNLLLDTSFLPLRVLLSWILLTYIE